jgi:hypothetical protein
MSNAATTQRTDKYRGGIQAGTTASSKESISLENTLKVASDIVAASRTDVERIKNFSAKALGKRLGAQSVSLYGMEPDGGIWRDISTGRVLMVAEAKKQGDGGNAIERWYKNYAVSTALGVSIYLTVCSGEGFFNGNTAERLMNTAVAVYEPERVQGGRGIWNLNEGGIWLHRYRNASGLEVEAAVTLLNDALDAAKSAATPA